MGHYIDKCISLQFTKQNMTIVPYTYIYIHTYISCNAFMWGSLRLAPMIQFVCKVHPYSKSSISNLYDKLFMETKLQATGS